MQDFDFSATAEKVEKEYNLGKGEYLKVKEGANRVRLVSIPLPHESVFQGKKTFKWLCQVLDRTDGKVKPYFMPHTVYNFIKDLQLDPDYRFKSIPMPFDVTINATGAGTKEVKYSITPARENKDLTTEEMNLINEAPTVQELQQKIRESEVKTEEPDYSKEQAENTMTEEERKFVEDVPF